MSRFPLCLGSVKPGLSWVNPGNVGVRWGVVGVAAAAFLFCFSRFCFPWFSECRAIVELGADEQEKKGERD